MPSISKTTTLNLGIMLIFRFVSSNSNLNQKKLLKQNWKCETDMNQDPIFWCCFPSLVVLF